MDTEKCPCCKAPCKVSKTEGRRVEFKNEYGDLESKYHHPLIGYDFVGSIPTIDDKIIIEGLEDLKLQIKNQYVSSGNRYSNVLQREKYRQIQDLTLAIKRLKELLNIQ